MSETLLPEGTTVPFSFRIEDPRGPLEDFDVLHDRRMHLIVVRRDLARFEHVHPTIREGTWSVELGPLEPGVWRAFADFSTGSLEITNPGMWTLSQAEAYVEGLQVSTQPTGLENTGAYVPDVTGRAGAPCPQCR